MGPGTWNIVLANGIFRQMACKNIETYSFDSTKRNSQIWNCHVRKKVLINDRISDAENNISVRVKHRLTQL